MQIFNQRKIFKSRNIDYRSRSPTGLVIAPTRELALQIQEVAETYGRPLGISNMCIYGKLISKSNVFFSTFYFNNLKAERQKDRKNLK